MDFLICYEHIVREIENDTLLKYELEKRGYSCKIIHFNDMDYYLHTTTEKAKVIVTPWLRFDDNVCRYLTMAKKPYKLVNLQWEQVYCENDIQNGLVRTSGQALQAYHMCWGENSRNRLIEQGVSEGNVAVVGAIQMDYGLPLFKDYYHSRKSIANQYGLDNNKKWNLLISSFAFANYSESGIKALEKEFNMSLTEYIEVHQKSQKMTLDWVERLLRVSDCEFIYRPHPAEQADKRLKEMVAKYPNFYVISDYSVKQWSRVCDKVNLWASTSNAELLAMHVDFVIVRPTEIPAGYEVESMRNEVFITDCEEFIRYNMSYDGENTASIEEGLKRIAHFYSCDPNYPAYKRTADYLEQVLKSEKGQGYHLTSKQYLRGTIDRLKRYVISVLTHKCYVSGSMAPVQHLPLKNDIKQNMKRAIEKRKDKEQLENAMLDYLRSHDF